MGIFWPDKQASRMQVVWYDSITPNGCTTMQGSAAWLDGQLIARNENAARGKTSILQEVFSEITDHSFTQTVYEGASDQDLKPTAIIHAVRLRQGPWK